MRWRCAAAPVLVVGPLALAACGGASGLARPDPGRWLSADAAARHATITLIAVYDAAAGGFNLNGANKGALLFSVPGGWTVTVRCVNNASDRAYGCALARSPGAPGAAVPQTAQTRSELAPGERASFSFTPRTPTRYRLVALTSGREPVGMWLTLAVTPSGLPSVRWVR